ncbi:MAG: hypothetical protein ACFFE4_22085, partial [Candidatus Thorarchaeota archaeon]
LITFVPNVKAVSDLVYLEEGEVTSYYYLDANKGDQIIWEFRTYNNPFIVYFRCHESPVILSHDKTTNFGVLRVLESSQFGFTFENIGDTGGGYLEFEIIVKNIFEIIDGYNLIIILGIISLILVISISRLKKMRIKNRVTKSAKSN